MRNSLLAAAMIVAAACTEPTVPPGLSRSGSEASQSGDESNVLSFGTVMTQLPSGFGPATLRYHANSHADGSATGTFSMFRIRNGLTSDFQGTVSCLAVDPVTGRAWIGGVVTVNNSTDPNQQLAIHQPGKDVWFRVVDNGKHDAVPDRSTVLGFEGASGIITSAQYCAQRPWLAGDANTFPVFDGDLKVKG